MVRSRLFGLLSVLRGSARSPTWRSESQTYRFARGRADARRGGRGIKHKRTKVRLPQSHGIVERLHRTLLDEHFRIEGGKTRFETIEEMRVALDAYLVAYNTKRPHQGRGMNGRTPIKAFKDGIPKAANKEVIPELKTTA